MTWMFSPEEIQDAWRYAKAAYKNQSKLDKIFGRAITIIDPILKGVGDACYIINQGDRVVVMFPGSNDVIDWALNLYVGRKHHIIPADDDGLHEGFKLGIDVLAQDIMEHLTRLRPQHLVLTGHSRGGALADMFLEMYGHHFDIDIDCITFAQPRIATGEYYRRDPDRPNLAKDPAKDRARVRYLRVANIDDAVPHLPPARYGFTHHGESLILGVRMPMWRRIGRFLAAWSRGRRRLPYGIKEHLLPAYDAALKRLGESKHHLDVL